MKKKTISLPKIGDIVYVDTDLYLGHGLDNKRGGKARVITVDPGGKFVIVEPFPKTQYYWESLGQKQKQLKKEFGDEWAHRDPDVSPELNEDYEGYKIPELDPKEIQKNRKIN